MNRNCIESVFISLVFVLIGMAEAADFAAGTGEPNDPYLIATAEQLFGADFSERGIHYQLCANIDLDRKTITPCQFRAHLDGAGFEIQNAVVLLGASLFGTVEAEGTVANLTLADLDLLSIAPEYGGPSEVVGAMARRNSGTITNCAVTGCIATQGIPLAGGFVGLNAGLIANCYFEGWVGADWEDTDADSEEESLWVGGLASYNSYSGTIASSFARSIVVGKRGLGGLVGKNSGTISNSYAEGVVIGDVGAGGLVSVNSGSLHRCYTISWVTGQMRGGLVGMAGWHSGTATDCLWEPWRTGCKTSGAGVGVDDLGAASLWFCPLNGWAGDPNWLVLDDPGNFENFPRLAWEGTDGEVISEVPFFWAPDAGSGTERDPYVIRTRKGLLCLCKASIYWDKHFVLAEDLDMHFDQDFSPIGICRGSSFSGTFDGNGHVIRNVVFDVVDNFGTDEATAWNLGLFGYVTGEVRNLNLENFRFEAGMNSRRVGLLAGWCRGVIKNCSATGSITVGENSQFIGELVGLNEGEVSDCEATATIKAGEGSTDIGGLVGAPQ